MERVVSDSIRFVTAYERLTGEHSAELPGVLQELEGHISELKTYIPTGT